MFHVARLTDPSVASLSVGGQQLVIVEGHVIVPMHLAENARRLKHVMVLLSGAYRTLELAISSVTGIAESAPAPASAPAPNTDTKADGDGDGDGDEDGNGDEDDSDKLV